MKLNVVDLFGAPGGMACGLEMTKEFNAVVCVDSDSRAAETYRGNFSSAAVVTDDIRKIRGTDILQAGNLQKGDVDVVVGGPPCQAFSTVGRVKIHSLKGGPRSLNGFPATRFIDDPRNTLYKHFVRIVGELKPSCFIMENVVGMLSFQNGRTVAQIKEDFRGIGYHTDHRILTASGFGVPQNRRRVVFIGNLMNTANLFPEENKTLLTSVWDAISDMPLIRAGEGEDPARYTRKAKTDYQRWARTESTNIRNHMARPHTTRDIKVFSHMQEGGKWKNLPPYLKRLYGYRDDVFNDKMRRLQRNKPSWTIVAHLAKDGYMFIHPTQPRTITVREAARLQSFPDTFVFSGSKSDQFRQVGNAVPPLMAKAIGMKVIEMLEDGA